jgi:hypothetical protein
MVAHTFVAMQETVGIQHLFMSIASYSVGHFCWRDDCGIARFLPHFTEKPVAARPDYDKY